MCKEEGLGHARDDNLSAICAPHLHGLIAPPFVHTSLPSSISGRVPPLKLCWTPIVRTPWTSWCTLGIYLTVMEGVERVTVWMKLSWGLHTSASAEHETGLIGRTA